MPRKEVNSTVYEYARIKPIEVDSRVEAAESQQEKHLKDDFSTSTTCDKMDLDVIDATVTDDTSDTELNAGIRVTPHLDCRDILACSISQDDDDADDAEDMDISQRDTPFVPQLPSPIRPPPRFQPPTKQHEPHSAWKNSSSTAKYRAASPDSPAHRSVTSTTAQPQRCRPAAQGGARHKPSPQAGGAGPRNNAAAPAGGFDEALDAELDAVMHNWRVVHAIAGRTAAPPSPLAAFSTHASFRLAS
jgi:hypothetical protein